MSARLFTIPMPEGGAEREVCWMTHHSCLMARDAREILEDRDIDLVQFSVGLVGQGMPAGIPFEVTTTDECGVCGNWLKAWFQWQKKVEIVGSLWRPR